MGHYDIPEPPEPEHDWRNHIVTNIREDDRVEFDEEGRTVTGEVLNLYLDGVTRTFMPGVQWGEPMADVGLDEGCCASVPVRKLRRIES